MIKISLALATLLIPGVAFSQEQPLSGLIVGAQAGYQSRSVEYIVGNVDFSKDRGDFVYGAFVGYDIAVNRLRLGVQAELMDGSSTLLSDDGAGTEYIVEPKGVSYAFTARAGMLVRPHSMVYARGGYAVEKNRILFTGPTILSIPITRRDEGLLIGAGFETELTSGITPRVEYRYRDLPNKLSSHQLLAGVGYRF